MNYPKVTFTLTSCKRLDLFKKTMNSFLETCLDRDLIERWIVNDDDSSASDIEEMKKSYPFLEIYSSLRRGQPSNLNSLFRRVQTEWFFHCEDDWLFLRSGHYIKELFDVAFDDEVIKNVTLRYWTGNIVTSKKNPNLKYNIHIYVPLNIDHAMMLRTDCNWWGYTLNPGLQHLPTVKKLGLYNESHLHNQEWDRPQAIRYYEMSLKRANLLTKYIEHIGEGRQIK